MDKAGGEVKDVVDTTNESRRRRRRRRTIGRPPLMEALPVMPKLRQKRLSKKEKEATTKAIPKMPIQSSPRKLAWPTSTRTGATATC